MSTLSLTGLGWKDGSKAIYDASGPVVGTEKRKARYWVYDYKEEVDRIVADRKAAGKTKEACNKARRDFAVLKGAWWNDHAMCRELQRLGTQRWFTNCSRKSVVHSEEGHCPSHAWGWYLQDN